MLPIDLHMIWPLELPLKEPEPEPEPARRPSGMLIPEFWSDNRVYAEWGKDINLEQMESIVKEKLILIDSDPGWYST